MCTKILDINLSAFNYRLLHDEFSIIRTNSRNTKNLSVNADK